MWGSFFAEVGRLALHVALPIAGTALSGLAVGVLKKQLDHVGLQVSEKEETKLKQTVYDAVLRTEELAHRDPTMTRAEKAEHCETALVKALPKVDIATIRDAIDATLPVLRSRGIGNKPR